MGECLAELRSLRISLLRALREAAELDLTASQAARVDLATTVRALALRQLFPRELAHLEGLTLSSHLWQQARDAAVAAQEATIELVQILEQDPPPCQLGPKVERLLRQVAERTLWTDSVIGSLPVGVVDGTPRLRRRPQRTT